MNIYCLDTCSWIYLANGREPVKFLQDILNEMNNNNLKIILPKTVLNEWGRNKERETIKSSVKDLFLELDKGIKEVSDVIDKVDGTSKIIYFLKSQDKSLKKDLAEIVAKIDDNKKEISKCIDSNIEKIEQIFSHANTVIIDASDDIVLKAGKMALEKKAPLHKKNGFADAIIILIFLEYLQENNKTEDNAAFISFNTNDFCVGKGKNAKLHQDLQPLFNEVNCKFFSHLAYAIKEINHTLVDDATITMIEDLEPYLHPYFCDICDGNDGYGNEVGFYEPIKVFNDNNVRFSDKHPKIPFNNIEYTHRSTIDTIMLGSCEYCREDYIKCMNCGTISHVKSDEEYLVENTIICACGTKYRWESSFDRTAVETVDWKILDDRTRVCNGCGEEFIDKLGIESCPSCEERYHNN